MPIFVNLQPCLTLGNLNFFLHTRCICVLCMIRTIYSTLCVFCEVKTSITLILKILNFSLNSDQDIQDETISVTKRKKEDTITTAAYKFVLISPKPDQEGNTLMFLSELREFPSAPCLAGKEKKNLMTARVSMLLKSRASLTCFRACFLPGRAMDLSAPRYI